MAAAAAVAVVVGMVLIGLHVPITGFDNPPTPLPPASRDGSQPRIFYPPTNSRFHLRPSRVQCGGHMTFNGLYMLMDPNPDPTVHRLTIVSSS